jgi:serine protease Do
MAAVEMENRLGMEVKEISILEARKRRLNSRDGVVVIKVDPQGPAARAGLEPGDIVYQINQQAIKGLNDYGRILEQLPQGQEALLLVRDWRTGETGYLTVVAQ